MRLCGSIMPFRPASTSAAMHVSRYRGVARGEWRCFAGGGLGCVEPPAWFGAELRKIFEG